MQTKSTDVNTSKLACPTQTPDTADTVSGWQNSVSMTKWGLAELLAARADVIQTC